ncbi:RsmB/NOP family class I SAM-dependent RNA methyltransferase [Albirhodobacter sp. R86504]|jgi:16S rRNA (cytosine967-C5)-methyltransferase|uniref:RsmB/NOP family class I SAM-dependent RNA methyltransferase n=1 Tax=Albirhodobacter sp. R86504 TaxID=3093848 RepID=UPI00366D2DE8
MTPAARIQAAIEILDRALRGEAAEAVLTGWARSNRFAGSGDRAGIRDLVYDALRCQASYAHLGGASATQLADTSMTGGGITGRMLMLGLLRAQGVDPTTLFTGEKFAPDALNSLEEIVPQAPTGLTALDCPAWLETSLRANLGAEFEAVMGVLRTRAPLFLRVNIAKASVAEAMAALDAEGIVTQPTSLAKNALEVIENPRKVAGSLAYTQGLVEVQDAASQAVIESLEITAGMKVLDYCAGGGGKVLAMAAMAPKAKFVAHDIDAGRTGDIPVRAKRAGAKISMAAPYEAEAQGPYDLVVIDAPCSGSGTWRRTPEAKWRLTPERLKELAGIQVEILAAVAPMVKSGGHVAYMTCSLLDVENFTQIESFLAANPDWTLCSERSMTPLEGGDGFYTAVLRKP